MVLTAKNEIKIYFKNTPYFRSYFVEIVVQNNLIPFQWCIVNTGKDEANHLTCGV